MGNLRYLMNRSNLLDDGEGATSRWCTKICARKDSGPILIMGGAEHGPPLVEFLKARINVDMKFMYDDFEHIKRLAVTNLSRELDSLNTGNSEYQNEEAQKLLQQLQHTLQTLAK